MRLTPLTTKDKKIFDKFFGLSRRQLSSYAFANLYIWKKLYNIKWAVIENNLCVFFMDKTGCFMNLSPLGSRLSHLAVSSAFKIMDSFNSNRRISRIENVEEDDLGAYERMGYESVFKSCDYLCKRSDLAFLKGDKFKSKRASYNYFIKHNSRAEYLSFMPKHQEECLELFDLWQEQRKSRSSDKIYQAMIDDSRSCLEVLLKNYLKLGLLGRVVKARGKIKAFSFGCRLNKNTFCVIYEISDLSVKGIAQFIFREFSSELKDCQYINTMDDSGLENLKKVKLSYHPLRLIPAYIIQRKNGQEH